LDALISETAEDRGWQHDVLRRAGRDVPLAYEASLREEAARLNASRLGASNAAPKAGADGAWKETQLGEKKGLPSSMAEAFEGEAWIEAGETLLKVWVGKVVVRKFREEEREEERVLVQRYKGDKKTPLMEPLDFPLGQPIKLGNSTARKAGKPVNQVINAGDAALFPEHVQFSVVGDDGKRVLHVNDLGSENGTRVEWTPPSTVKREVPPQVFEKLRELTDLADETRLRALYAHYAKVVSGGQVTQASLDLMLSRVQERRAQIPGALREALSEPEDALFEEAIQVVSDQIQQLLDQLTGYEKTMRDAIESGRGVDRIVQAIVGEKDFRIALGVDAKADWNEIKTRFRILSRELHSDLHPGDPEAARRLKSVNEAHEALELLHGPKASGGDQAKLTLGELFSHFRPGQAVRGLAGILFNAVRYPFIKDKLRAELQELQGTLNELQDDERQRIQIRELDVPWYRMLWNFGAASKNDRIASVNLLLPREMKQRTLLHEALHVLHPEWNEAKVIAMTDHYIQVHQGHLQALAFAVSQVAQDENAARKASAPDTAVESQAAGGVIALIRGIATQSYIREKLRQNRQGLFGRSFAASA
jgi:hypothetical protein